MNAYFEGGAILPMGGHKGYALAVVGELIGHALLGPHAIDGNWLLLVVDTANWCGSDQLRPLAEEVLDDLRTCPPAPGFDTVEIPGERERAHREAAGGVVAIPEATWAQINQVADRLDAKPR